MKGKNSFSFLLMAKKKLEKYFAILKINYYSTTAYNASLVSSLIIVFFRVFLLCSLYSVIYSTVAGGSVNGFSFSDTVWILVFMNVMELSFKGGTLLRIAGEVKNGDIAYSLSRPYSYFLYHWFLLLGKSFFPLFVNVLVGTFIVLTFIGLPNFSLFSFVLGLVFCLIGAFLNFTISFTLGLLAFWFEEVRPFNWIYSKLLLIAGGSIVPLQFFPEWIKPVLNFLPFSKVFYFPATVIFKFNWNDLFYGTFILVFWTVVALGLVYFVFNKAKRNVSINGG